MADDKLGALGNAGLGIGTGAVSSLIGNAIGLGNQSNLQELQIRGQKELSKYNQELALDMWNKTNAEAQVQHLKNAGLNVGLMYGKGGGGGATTNFSAGSVTGGQDKTDTSKGMGMLLQGMQMEQIKNEIENIKANTEKTTAEKNEIEARTPTYKKGMEKTDAEINEIASRMNVNAETVKKIIQEVEESKSKVSVNNSVIELNKSSENKNKAETTNIETLTPWQEKLMQQQLKSYITTNTYLDERQRQELNNMVVDNWYKIKEIKLKARETDIKQFAEEIKANYPSIWNVVGKGADTVTGGMESFMNWIFGSEDYDNHKMKK